MAGAFTYYDGFGPIEGQQPPQAPPQQGSFGGAYAGPNDAEAQGYNYSQGVTGAALPAGATPTPAQLRQLYAQRGNSEDFNRYSDAQLQAWLDTGLWDPQSQMFRSEADGTSLVEKPTETPEGWEAFGQGYRRIPAAGGGAPGGGGSFASGSSTWGTQPGAGGAPQFSYQPFQAPNLADDPGYQFRLKEGQGAIERSAAARGTLGTGGTLKDLMEFGQGLASQEYGNAFGRANQGWNNNLGAGQFEWNTRYQPWSQQFQAGENRWQTGQQNDLSRWTTQFGGQLSRDLQRENNIFGLLGGQAPQMPGYTSF